MIIIDTSFLVALFDAGEPSHENVLACAGSSPGPLVVSPYVVAELDYLLLTRFGVAVEMAALDHLASGAWQLETFSRADVAAALALIAKYKDERIGITDASLVVLAERLGTNAIGTLDRRHFSVLRNRRGKPFDIVP